MKRNLHGLRRQSAAATALSGEQPKQELPGRLARVNLKRRGAALPAAVHNARIKT